MELKNSSKTDHFDDAIRSLPLSIKLKLIALKRIQTHKQSLNNEFQTEVTEVLQKYHAQSDSIIINANEVIEAKLMPNLETTRNLGDYFTASEIVRGQEIPLTSKPFENYWFTVLINSKLQVAIMPEEEEILLQLQRVIMTSAVSKRDKRYKIAFFFEENTFFANKEIICDIKYDHDNNLLEARSNKIHWYPNQSVYKNLTKSHRKAGGFFKLFKRFDKNAQNDLLRKYRIDISFIASELIHEIIPNSFHHYMGVSKTTTSARDKEYAGAIENKFDILKDEALLNDDSVEEVDSSWNPLKQT